MKITGGLARVLGEGWRIFFLSAGLYAVVAIGLWTGWLALQAAGGVVSDFPFGPSPHLWHAHEMVFGYASAAMGGFFLTAVPNWTGTPAARRGFIAGAAGLWLVGRGAVWASGILPAWGVAMADLAFLPVLAAKILTQLLHRPKPQNMMFLGILGVIWTGNLMVHLDWMGLTATAGSGLRLGLYATCVLILVLGGRVTPAFTRNAMHRVGWTEGLPRNLMPLDAATIALTLLAALASALAPAPLFGTLALAAGVAQLVRGALWRPGWTRGQPILWVLHAGMAALVLGLVLTGLAAFGVGSELAALHVLGIGAVGGMTLGVMSRAALGHGGHPLVAPSLVALGYALLPLAAAVRWIGSAFGAGGPFAAALIAGSLWCLAFALATAALWPVLTGPRTSD